MTYINVSVTDKCGRTFHNNSTVRVPCYFQVASSEMNGDFLVMITVAVEY